MPRISLGTVYRNLEILTNTGEILCLDRAGIQKHFDGNAMPHQHVRCKQCGKIGDMTRPLVAPPLQDASAENFTIYDVDIEFIGLCKDCEKGTN